MLSPYLDENEIKRIRSTIVSTTLMNYRLTPPVWVMVAEFAKNNLGVSESVISKVAKYVITVDSAPKGNCFVVTSDDYFLS